MLAIALTLPAAAQQPAAAQLPVATFTAPDGSRFVLIADPGVPQVHWAIASWIDGSDDPPGLEGLARAAIHAAQGGTWLTGSRDAERERRALDERDGLLAQLRGSPDDGPLRQQAATLDDRCRQLFDPTVFPRVLAAAPGHRLELHERGPVAVLAVTTIAAAIGEVGRLLVERREQQPLRGVDAEWSRLTTARAKALTADPHRALHAEVLALTMPGHALARGLQLPGGGSPTRSQALAAWAASQRPERTVHVLLGDFDAASAEATLRATFAVTSLPPRTAAPQPPPQPLAGVRHSIVPGTPRPAVAIGWVLPATVDANVLATAMAWLGDGDDSALARELQRAGRTDCRIRCRAPWPAGEDRGLFLVTVEAERDEGLAGL
ncbi:MAG: insulinase family protein, partial [Planctomycetota bacterium]